MSEIYNYLYEWLTGIPGLLAPIIAITIGVVMSYITGNFIWYFIFIFIGVILLLLPTILSF